MCNIIRVLQYWMHGCIYIFNRYILLMKWSLYHYLMTFFVSCVSMTEILITSYKGHYTHLDFTSFNIIHGRCWGHFVFRWRMFHKIGSPRWISHLLLLLFYTILNFTTPFNSGIKNIKAQYKDDRNLTTATYKVTRINHLFFSLNILKMTFKN